MTSALPIDNMEALERGHHAAAERIREGLPEAAHPALARSATGQPIIVLDKTPLHSAHDPLAEAEAIVARAGIARANSILVYGFGAGHVLRETLAQAGSGARVIALILDPGSFLVALESLDLRDLLRDPRLTLALGDLRQIIAALPPESEDMRVVVHPPLLAAVPESLAPLAQMATELHTTQSSRLAQFGQVRENIAANLSLILNAEPVSALSRALAGQRLLLVAPGPSLEEQLPRLTRSPRPFLVALDTSLRVLLAAGIRPDLAVTLDPLERNLAKFEQLEIDFALAFFESARPEIARLSPRPLFACEAGGLLDRAHPFFGRAGRYRSEGSSLGAALDILLSLGVAQIGLVGADLALTGGKSHAGAGVRVASGRTRDVPALGGGMAVASESLWLHRRRLLRRLEQEASGRVIDLRAAGATLPGLVRRDLASWLDDLDPAFPAPAIGTPARPRQDPDRSAARGAAERALRESI